jgi:hypothetical protein
VALGTLATALSMAGQALRESRPDPRVVRTGTAVRLPEQLSPTTAEPEYAQPSPGGR